MTNKEYERAYSEGYAQALQDEADRQYKERLRIASEDPTGQDLDDFLERTHEPDNFEHVECPIQRAELRFGA